MLTAYLYKSDFFEVIYTGYVQATCHKNSLNRVRHFGKRSETFRSMAQDSSASALLPKFPDSSDPSNQYRSFVGLNCFGPKCLVPVTPFCCIGQKYMCNNAFPDVEWIILQVGFPTWCEPNSTSGFRREVTQIQRGTIYWILNTLDSCRDDLSYVFFCNIMDPAWGCLLSLHSPSSTRIHCNYIES